MWVFFVFIFRILFFQNDAVVFYEEYNGMQFDNLDTHKCTLLYVDKIESVSFEI